MIEKNDRQVNKVMFLSMPTSFLTLHNVQIRVDFYVEFKTFTELYFNEKNFYLRNFFKFLVLLNGNHHIFYNILL